MVLCLIVVAIGFICTYMYVRSSLDNSKSKTAPQKTFVIALFMVLATLSLSIGASILQNIMFPLNPSIEEPNDQNSNPEADSIQEENQSSAYPNPNTNNAALDGSESSNLHNDSQNFENSSKSQLVAKKENGKWGYVNQAGEIVISFEYDFANDFSEGLASVRKEDKWGFIDETGNTVIPFTYDGAWNFIDGLAPIFKDELWGFINKNDDLVIPFQYENISFSNSTYYDENGNPIEY